MYNALLKIIRPHGFLVGDSAPQTLEYKKAPGSCYTVEGSYFAPGIPVGARYKSTSSLM